MLPKKHLLPGAEGERAVGEWDGHRGLCERGAHVRGHIVRTFCAMAEEGLAVGNESGKKTLKVSGDLVISAFIDEQRGAGVRQKQCAKARVHLAVAKDSTEFSPQGHEGPS